LATKAQRWSRGKRTGIPRVLPAMETEIGQVYMGGPKKTGFFFKNKIYLLFEQKNT
jgi:hypothetical protein